MTDTPVAQWRGSNLGLFAPVDLRPYFNACRQTAPAYVVCLHLCELLLPAPLLEAGAGAGRPGAGEAQRARRQRWGEPVATYTLVYGDGSEHAQPIRWGFEVNGPGGTARAFTAVTHLMDKPVDFRGPYLSRGWGAQQRSVLAARDQPGVGRYWVYALPNPHRDRSLRALRLEGTGMAVVGVAALTRFSGRDHPLRHRRLESFRVHLPTATLDAKTGRYGDTANAPASPRRPVFASGAGADGVEASIDLGIIAREYAVPAFNPDTWLSGEGLTTPLPPPAPAAAPAERVRELMLDLTAAPDATLSIGDRPVPLRDAYERGEARSADGTVRVELLTPHRTWVHVRVEDGSTGKAVASRVHFRAADGRYLPPYGHRHEVNDNYFEDYGADLKVHGTQYAYVDGTFQVELPVGDVYVELLKGFEYRPLRQKLAIRPGQRELALRLERPFDWRRQGWATADTHVHFLSPQTAWLEGQAEGLNLINLLATQLGGLFSNFGDITGALSGVSRDDTLVWVGSENRQHLLGHISLLGAQGEPVVPMVAAGPPESYLGDPTWATLAEWAEAARRKQGLAIMSHLPFPIPDVEAAGAWPGWTRWRSRPARRSTRATGRYSRRPAPICCTGCTGITTPKEA